MNRASFETVFGAVAPAPVPSGQVVTQHPSALQRFVESPVVRFTGGLTLAGLATGYVVGKLVKSESWKGPAAGVSTVLVCAGITIWSLRGGFVK